MKSLLRQYNVLTKNDLLKINGGYGGSSGGGSSRGYSGSSGGSSSSSGNSASGRYCSGGSYSAASGCGSNRVSYSSSSSGGATSTRFDYGKLSAFKISDEMLKPTCPGFSHPKNPFSGLNF